MTTETLSDKIKDGVKMIRSGEFEYKLLTIEDVREFIKQTFQINRDEMEECPECLKRKNSHCVKHSSIDGFIRENILKRAGKELVE